MSSTAQKCLGSAFISEVVQDLVNVMGRGVDENIEAQKDYVTGPKITANNWENRISVP